MYIVVRRDNQWWVGEADKIGKKRTYFAFAGFRGKLNMWASNYDIAATYADEAAAFAAARKLRDYSWHAEFVDQAKADQILGCN